jgi:hypothetical protein
MTLIFSPTGELSLQGKVKERWRELCEQAAIEQDPRKLSELVAEIDRLLEEKQTRLAQSPPRNQGSNSPSPE